jgi:hypothetical protein
MRRTTKRQEYQHILSGYRQQATAHNYTIFQRIPTGIHFRNAGGATAVRSA